MLIDEFLCKREVLEKEPHTRSPPPLSVVGVSNKDPLYRENLYVSE
jgi:hypothetical protein